MPNLSIVRGQHRARRALEIAAAGGHHLLFSGFTGRWQVAAFEVSSRNPAAARPARRTRGRARVGRAGTPRGSGSLPPFRAPITRHPFQQWLAGGLAFPGPARSQRPTTAFCSSMSSASLRPPRSTHCGSPSRTASSRSLALQTLSRSPADVQVVAATNPCPCGFHGDRRKPCELHGGSARPVSASALRPFA